MQLQLLTGKKEKIVTNMAKRFYHDNIKDNYFKNDKRFFGIEIEISITNKNNILQILSSSKLCKSLKKYSIIPEYGSYQVEINPPPHRVKTESYKILYDDIKKIKNLAEDILTKDNNQLNPIGIPFYLDHIDFQSKNIITPKERYLISTKYFHTINKPGSNLIFCNNEQINLPGNSGLSIINELHIHLQALNSTDIIRLFNYSQMITAPFVSIAANSGIVNGKKLIFKDYQLSIFSQAEGLFDGPSEVPRVGFFPCYINSLDDYFEKILDFKPLYLPLDGLDETAFESIISKYFGWTRIRVGSFPKKHLRIEFRPMATQPTIIEHIALTEFFVNILTSLLKNNLALLPHKYLEKNFFHAMKDGMNATIYWDIGSGVKKYQVSTVLRYLFDLSKKGMYSDLILNRINQKQSPIDRLLQENQNFGYQKTIKNYRFCVDNEVPYIK